MEIISLRKRTTSRSSRQRNWGQMDPNILLVIFHKLLLCDLLQAVPHVCSSWRMAASQTGFFISGSHLNLEYCLGFLPGRERAIYTNLLRLALKMDAIHLDRVKFPENLMLPKEVVLLIAQRSTCLKNLRLPQISLDWFSPCLLSKTLPYWKSLTSFEAATSSVCAEACLRLLGQYCKRLTHLGIKGIIDTPVAEAIATCFPGIQSLDLKSCFFSELALDIILEGVTNLKTMNLTHSICGNEKNLKKIASRVVMERGAKDLKAEVREKLDSLESFTYCGGRTCVSCSWYYKEKIFYLLY